MDKKVIIYGVIIIIILAAVYFGQQAYSRAISKTLISGATSQAQTLIGKGSNWAMSKIYPKINDGVQSGGAKAINAIDTAKKNISESISTKIGNYFSGIANAVEGKVNTACQTTPTQTPTP